MYYTIFAKREENFLAKIDVAPLAGARIEIAHLEAILSLLSMEASERNSQTAKQKLRSGPERSMTGSRVRVLEKFAKRLGKPTVRTS